MQDMRTTVEISDDLFRRAKSEAALRGKKFKDLIQEGLNLALETPHPGASGRKKRPSVHDLIKDSIGIMNSGIPDLASNPKHLEGLGRDAMGHR
jgi:hypothetical protein